MTAMARSPVLPEPTLVGGLSAHLRRPLLGRKINHAITFDNSLRTYQFDPKATFKVGLINGREAAQSGLWLNGR
jgi:hypothetical protein